MFRDIYILQDSLNIFRAVEQDVMPEMEKRLLVVMAGDRWFR